MSASILGSGLAFVDGSVVNVALPAIEAGLHPGGTDMSWALTAYLIPLGALTLLGGALGDRLGRRKLFVLGISIFVLASLVCACAPSFPVFIAGRVSQGLGAALLMPNSLAMLGAAFEGDRRTNAIATWAAAGSLTGAIGPLLGGALVDGVIPKLANLDSCRPTLCGDAGAVNMSQINHLDEGDDLAVTPMVGRGSANWY